MTDVKWAVVGALCGGAIFASGCAVGYYVIKPHREKNPTEGEPTELSTHQERQQQPPAKWTVSPEHEWARIDSELSTATALSIQFDQSGSMSTYSFSEVESENEKPSVQDVALWICSLLHHRQEVSENRLDLYDKISQNKCAWGVEGDPFAFEALCAVTIRTNRPVQLVWTVHFSESVVEVLERAVQETDKLEHDDEPRLRKEKKGPQYVDLYVTATDSEHYGPDYGRFVLRIFYTVAEQKNE